MTLQDVFDWLRYGELAQSGLYDSETKDLLETGQEQIISHVVLGLRDLHTKFPLKERTVTIQQYDDIALYVLKSVYAQSNPATPPDGKPKYIIDSSEYPFTDDILHIEQAYDELGNEVPLNEPACEGSLFTPAYNVVQIPRAVSTNSTFISYRADHPKIPLTGINLLATSIELPESHFQALLFFVAWRVFASMAGTDSSPVSSEYMMKYMNEVAQIIEKDLNGTYTTERTLNVKEQGWV